MCGEQFIYAREVVGDQGSPTRVRGTGGAALPFSPSSRITPACAGNRKPKNEETLAPEDHPRVCGEQFF